MVKWTKELHLINKKQALSKQGSVFTECTVIHLTYEPALLVLNKFWLLIYSLFLFFKPMLRGGGDLKPFLYTS